MTSFVKDIAGKLKPVLGNGAYMLLPGLVNQLLAFFVIRLSGEHTWGEVVQWQLYYYLVTAITAWGNKDFLLVRFSRQPEKIKEIWQQSFVWRLFFLLVPVIILTVLIYPAAVSVHLCIWIGMRFISQSLESVVVYTRRFSYGLLSEVCAFVPLLLLIIYRDFFNIPQILNIISLTHIIRSLVIMLSYRSFILSVFKVQSGFIHWRESVPFVMLNFAGFLQSKSDLYCMNFFADKNVTGNYQVLMSYVLICMFVPGFLAAPFIRNIYEQSSSGLEAIQRKLFIPGILAGVISAFGIYAVMNFIYLLKFGLITYLMAAYYVMTPYFYLIYIYLLYKQQDQSKVMFISFISIAFNMLLCVLLIPVWGVEGAMCANVGSQTLLWILYFVASKKYVAS